MFIKYVLVTLYVASCFIKKCRKLKIETIERIYVSNAWKLNSDFTEIQYAIN